MNLEDTIDAIMRKNHRDPTRLDPLADYIKFQLDKHGLSGVRGGTGGELSIVGIARPKNWDIAYDFSGKSRLLISLKSLWSNASGTIPNRIDELMGETANVQQMSPEIVTGYVLLFDIVADSSRREDNKRWSEFFEEAIRKLTIRKAPLWNQGLLEGTWFIKIDSSQPYGSRLIDAEGTAQKCDAFIISLLKELTLREPAIKLSRLLP